MSPSNYAAPGHILPGVKCKVAGWPARPTRKEFGQQRLAAELRTHGKEPLEAMYQAVLGSVSGHGAQFDDQSLLFIRQL